MPVFETYSKRKRKLERAGQTDVYQYDSLPVPFRKQVVFIWLRAIGYYVPAQYDGMLSALNSRYPQNDFWYSFFNLFRRELGEFEIGRSGHNPSDQCQQYLLNAETDGALDIIDLSFQIIDQNVRKWSSQGMMLPNCVEITADEAISELNIRFREHGIGYQFVGKLIREDSQYIHEQVVMPAVSLLHHTSFRGAEEEFLHAHEHYRHGRYKEAIVEALKALESTLKSICSARGWAYTPNDTAQRLIGIVFENGLLPSMLQAQFSSLRGVLESGLPTLRNRTSGHGQGINPIEVPAYTASYALHMAASNIVFLVEAHVANV